MESTRKKINFLCKNVSVPSITTTTQLSFPLTHSIKSSPIARSMDAVQMSIMNEKLLFACILVKVRVNDCSVICTFFEGDFQKVSHFYVCKLFGEQKKRVKFPLKVSQSLKAHASRGCSFRRKIKNCYKKSSKSKQISSF